MHKFIEFGYSLTEILFPGSEVGDETYKQGSQVTTKAKPKPLAKMHLF